MYRAKLLPFLADIPNCLVAMEACANAHYWAREISALAHEVRLIAPVYVKLFVKRSKHDAAGPEATGFAIWTSYAGHTSPRAQAGFELT